MKDAQGSGLITEICCGSFGEIAMKVMEAALRWRVGQKLACDRREHLLTGCFVIATELDSVKISCPAAGVVVFGQQQCLEEMGWQPADQR